MKHIQTFDGFLNENINTNKLENFIRDAADEYGGFDDPVGIEISNNKIMVFHTEVGKNYLDQVKEGFIDKILEELDDSSWVLAEQTPKYFMLVKR
jgi:hypothetical protein